MASRGVYKDLAEHLPDLASLESRYEQSSRQCYAIYADEEARLLRLRILILEDENDDLHAQLLQDDYRIDELESEGDQLRDSQGVLEVEVDRLRLDLRNKAREICVMRTELQSLNGVSTDSTKLLTEKLALSREISTLRPEVEHLRSQNVSQQSLLAEKLSLERQLSTMLVELQNEKRATQRVKSMEGAKHVNNRKLETQVEQLQSEINSERRDKQKAEREMQKMSTDFEARKAVLESRLDAFRDKLKASKEQPNEVQSTTQNNKPGKIGKQVNSVGHTTDTPTNARKRTIREFHNDTAVGTPGDVPAKKSKNSSSLPGDKSTFSITPFLNRTASAAPDSPGQLEGNRIGVVCGPSPAWVGNDQEISKGASAKGISAIASPRQRKAAQLLSPKKIDVLGNVAASKLNAKATLARRKRAVPALEQVTEEIHDENLFAMGASNKQARPAMHLPSSKSFDPSNTSNVGQEATKKKRKLFGGALSGTLFDEDDGENARGRGKGALANGSLSLRRGSLAPKMGALAGGFDFSPLKKDRRKFG